MTYDAWAARRQAEHLQSEAVRQSQDGERRVAERKALIEQRVQAARPQLHQLGAVQELKQVEGALAKVYSHYRGKQISKGGVVLARSSTGMSAAAELGHDSSDSLGHPGWYRDIGISVVYDAKNDLLVVTANPCPTP